MTVKTDVPCRIVLLEPEIPQNTGSVARTCAATGASLHLVGKLGFRIDEHAVRRAGLDYWHLVDLHTHPTLDDFVTAYPAARLAFFSAKATKSYLDADLAPGDAFVFGRESVGLPPELLAQHAGRVFGIPMPGAVRSLNLSNAVAVVLFELLRRTRDLAEGVPVT